MACFLSRKGDGLWREQPVATQNGIDISLHVVKKKEAKKAVPLPFGDDGDSETPTRALLARLDGLGKEGNH